MSQQAKELVVVDEPSIREVITLCLQRTGYRVMQASDGDASREAIAAHAPTSVALELMLPKVDGPEIVRSVRAYGDTPITILTARGEKSLSRATGGAGLGLASARGIVETHGGDVRVESQPGEGAQLTFTLSPLVRRPLVLGCGADGQQWGTKVTAPLHEPRRNSHSYDGCLFITAPERTPADGPGGWLEPPVMETAPRDKDCNGGRWAILRIDDRIATSAAARTCTQLASTGEEPSRGP